MKSKDYIRRIMLCVLLAFLGMISYGQSYLTHLYSEIDGLPSATVHDINQDQLGRMWFATRSGIAVYDGMTWQKYTISDGLPVLAFGGIRFDWNGKPWALGNSGQGNIKVSYFDPQHDPQWRNIKGKPGMTDDSIRFTSFQIMNIDRTDQPSIIIGTRKHGLFLWNRGEWENITEKDGLLSNTVNGVASLDEKFYVATDKGISIIKFSVNGSVTIDNELNRLLGLPSEPIKGIGVEYMDKFPDSNLLQSRVWLYNPKWLGYFEVGRFKLKTYPVQIPIIEKNNEVRLQSDYRSGIYVGAKYELLFFNYRTLSWTRLDTQNGLIGGGANSLFIDFEKNIWIACDRGVSKISSRRFSNFQMKHGLMEDEVTSVLEYEPGNFVLGHNLSLTFYDGKEFRGFPLFTKENPGNPMCRVLEMKLDSKKNIWVALSFGGLIKIDRDRKLTRYGQMDGLPKQVISLWLDERDNLWIGTEVGIYYSPGTAFTPKKSGNCPFLYVRKIFGSSGKLRYIASVNSGVSVYRHNEWKNYQVPSNIFTNAVYAILKDSKNRLLVGTLRGLFTLGNDALKKFQTGNFQLDRPVYSILEDHKSRLWFGTDNGVIRWDGREERKYSINEGLAGQETNRDALIEDSMGRTWIGTTHGVSIYNEIFDSNIRFNPPPRLQLLSMKVAGKKFQVNSGAPIRLEHDENTIAFSFRGISFIDEKAIRFKSKLEGFDKDWSEENYPYNQVIYYSNLPPGDYHFHIKARNMLGVWSDVVTSPDIKILRPFYRQWWFYVLFFIVIGAFFYSISRFISGRRYAALLEKQVEERTNQLKAAEQQLVQAQKMEAIGVLAGGIAHDFNNVLGVIMGYTELAMVDLPKNTQTHDYLEQVLVATYRAVEMVNQILTFSRQGRQSRTPLSLTPIVTESLDWLQPSLPPTIQILRNFRAKNDLVLADASLIRKVMMNLCSNAADAMKEKGGILEVSLDEVSLDSEYITVHFPGNEGIKPGSYIHLSVSDTGYGIPGNVLNRIFDPFFTTKEVGEGVGMGLAVIHGIVKSHNGDITVTSEPGKGSTFHIYLPWAAATPVLAQR